MVFAKFNGRYDNFGDVLIFASLYNELRKHDEVHLLGESVDDLGSVSLRFRRAYVKALIAKLTKWKPSIIFDPPGARFAPRNPVNLSLQERCKRAMALKLWQMIGAKFYIVGISVDGDAKRSTYSHYSKIGVRDFPSLDKLAQVNSRANFCPDMSCLQTPVMPDIAGDDVLISLRKETPDDGYSKNYAYTLEESLPLVMEALSTDDNQFVFYSQVMEDDSFNKGLAAQSFCSRPSNYLEQKPTLGNYRDIFKGYRYVISNRLHVLLPAMIQGIVPIALVSRAHKKIVNLFTSHGFEVSLLFVDDACALEEQLKKVLAESESIRENNYQALRAFQKDTESFIRAMLDG